MRKRIFALLFLFFLLWPAGARAQEYKTVYDVHYAPRLNDDSEVSVKIKIINLRSDRYVKEFTLSFPKNFVIADLTARDDYGPIAPAIENQEQFLKVSLNFSNPAIGKNLENNFYLSFREKNLFKTEGNIWEVILPTIGDKENTTFNIQISLPEETEKKLSLAKPKPTKIAEGVIYWDDVKSRTVYATFGESQLYEVKLNYRLANDELRRVYYDIALPPETLYQKVFINSLKPAPEKVYLDADDNLLARYTLNIKEQKQIVFDGAVEVFAKAQSVMRDYAKQKFAEQKEYLLTPQKFWRLDKSEQSGEMKNLTAAGDIYAYVVKKLNYDYDRAGKDIKRLGAQKVLAAPEQAVCMEFTDLFIALARRRGIYAREINGYGVSQDQSLRPLSRVGDILHAWPEYYDEKNQLWIPLDPTWENTSGIDYFSSFDMNHIVFAIHGQNPDEPAPAGAYKLKEDSKDVLVTATSVRPTELVAVSATHNLPSNIADGRRYQGKIYLKNVGNVYLKHSLLTMTSEVLTIAPAKITVPILAPYQRLKYSFDYEVPRVSKNQPAAIFFSFNGKTIGQADFKISPFYQNLIYAGLGVGIGVLVSFVIYFYVKRRF